MARFENSIYDFLTPMEEESFYGWTIRMLQLYSPTGMLSVKSKQDIIYLFGENVSLPGIYFQNGLEHFVSKFAFSNHTAFPSVKDILNRFTVLPFYMSFLEEKSHSSIYDAFLKPQLYIHIEERLGMRYRRNAIEGKRYLKICPICINKPENRYMKREHQIPGNFICREHQIELQRIEYIPEWGKLNIFERLSEAETYEINDLDRKYAIALADVIHQIFRDGFKIGVKELKQKIRSKMRKLGYLDEKFTFIDYHHFLSDFENDTYFMYVSKEEVMFNAIYDTKDNVNPIYYLLLIVFFFNDLGSLYSYELEFPNREISKQYKYLSWDHTKNHSLDYYKKTTSAKYFENYVIMGETDDSIVVKHKVCGKFFCVSKNRAILSECRNCNENGYLKMSEDVQCNDKISSEETRKYNRYLYPQEYGERYGKKGSQVRKHCTAGRIPGAIKIGNKAWLIPEDARYPEDRRYKK